MRYKPRSKKTGMFPYEAEVYRNRPRRKGVKYEYETTKLAYTIKRNYVPDFTITLPSGRQFHLEIKGYFRYEDQVKMRAVKKDNPNLDIRMLFPKTSQKNIAWCVKNDIPYAIGSIPDEWLDDTP